MFICYAFAVAVQEERRVGWSAAAYQATLVLALMEQKQLHAGLTPAMESLDYLPGLPGSQLQ